MAEENVTRETMPEPAEKAVKKAVKSSKAEVEKRVGQVVTMLLDGFSHADIVRYGAKNWQVASRMCDKYIQKANKVIEESAKVDRERDINWHIAARKQLMAQAKAKGDNRLVRDMLKDLGDLQGLYPKRQLEIETKNVPVTRDEIIAALARFAEKAGLSLEEYCDREGINLDEVRGDIVDEPDYSNPAG